MSSASSSMSADEQAGQASSSTESVASAKDFLSNIHHEGFVKLLSIS